MEKEEERQWLSTASGALSGRASPSLIASVSIVGGKQMEIEKSKIMHSLTIKTKGSIYDGTKKTIQFENMRMWIGSSGALYLDFGVTTMNDFVQQHPNMVRVQLDDNDAGERLWKEITMALLAS